ncbi:MAG: maleylacetoacetate isomerase [Betaproteobacteria bacterium]
MKLYTFFRSSASYRVRIALNHKGLAYEPALISLPKAEHLGGVFKAVSPQGLVPVLDDGKHVLTQSLAIIEYLDEVHPGPKLLPADPFERAYVRALSQIIACEIHPLNNLRVLKYVRKTYGLEEEGVNSWYRHWIAEGFAMMESHLAGHKLSGTYCLGDQLGMADCCLVPQVFNAQRFDCDLSPYPAVMAIHEACMKLPAVIAAQPSAQPDAMP